LRGETEYWPDVAQEPAGPTGSKLLIAVPFYKNEQLVSPLLESLILCAADLAAIGAEVVLFNDSPDYLPLQTALAAILPRAQAAFACRLMRNERNLGFVGTMNAAIAEAVSRRLDVLLLNSDTIVQPGAFPEMLRIAALDPMIAFVNPRSDNATLATLPIERRASAEAAEFDAAPYAMLAAQLPEFSYVPTAVGFCMLIRWHIIAEFGGFDPVFGAGYNEENDLVMRAGRCGYRAVIANRAFVRHEGEKSFAMAEQSKTALENVNSAILQKRYPEYSGLVAAYFASPEAVAEHLLSKMIPDEAGRLDFAFDFSSFADRHTGTSKAGRQLLQSAVEGWRQRFNIFVLCSPGAYEFHGYSELGIPRRDPDGPEKFAVIFRVGQVFDWHAIRRLIMKAAVFGIYMLDTISLDCTQLTSAELYDIWQFSLARSDFFVTPSGYSLDQVRRRFALPTRVMHAPALHSLDLDDYMPGGVRPAAKQVDPGKFVLLVIGNHFPHKFLVQTANALAAAFSERSIVALGQAKLEGSEPFNPYGLPQLTGANLTGVDVGHFTDEELVAFYGDADVVVFPSHYEGFGFPIMDALVARRPIFVRKLPVFQELYEGLGRNPNIYFYETTEDLVARLQEIPVWQEVRTATEPGIGAARSAGEILALVDAALLQVQYRIIVDRLRAVRVDVKLIARPGQAAQSSVQTAQRELLDQVASFAAVRFEWFVRRALQIRIVYLVSRAVFRLLRPVVRGLRAMRNAVRPDA
jgi:GT2 family glycosyltransferase